MNIEFQHEQLTPSKIKLTISIDGEVKDVDTVAISSKNARAKYIDGLLKEYPGLEAQQHEIAEKLLGIASQLTDDEGTANDEIEETAETPLEISKKQLAETDEKTVQAAEQLLRSPDLIEKIVQHVKLLGLAGERENVVTICLIGVSRFLKRPLAGCVSSASSAGKSFTVQVPAKLFPPEAVLFAHKISPTALYHLANGGLVHRWIVAGERNKLQDDTTAETTKALREMISDGKLTSAITQRDEANKLVTVVSEQPGPIAYIETTTLGTTEINNEDVTRMLLLCSDESTEQTERIFSTMLLEASQPKGDEITDGIIKLHHTAQRLLKPYQVKIPFAKKLQNVLPLDRIEARRTIGHLLNAIRASAILHQYQREIDADGFLVASIADYNVCREFFAVPLARCLGCELSTGAQACLDSIGLEEEFTISSLAETMGKHPNTIRGRIKELVATGQVEITSYGHGSGPNNYKQCLYPKAIKGLELPEIVEEVAA